MNPAQVLLANLSRVLEEAMSQGLTEPEALGVIDLLRNSILYAINKRVDGAAGINLSLVSGKN